jgi:hypothetical protein
MSSLGCTDDPGGVRPEVRRWGGQGYSNRHQAEGGQRLMLVIRRERRAGLIHSQGFHGGPGTRPSGIIIGEADHSKEVES